MITVYTSCPPFGDLPGAKVVDLVTDAARATEQAGFRGMLVHSDNKSLDPWATAKMIIERTERVVPLIAVNPVYMHPFAVAKAISTLAFLHGRGVDVNLVSGGFARHMSAVGAYLEHDLRYDRLVEFAEIVRRLLTENRPLTYEGTYYTITSASLLPRMDAGLMPRFLTSGTSDACVAATARLDTIRLAYPRHITEYGAGSPLEGTGVGFGIIARESAGEAWAIARSRFPHDPTGEEMHDWAATEVESRWHRSLSADAALPGRPGGAYWLYPFRAYRTFCPYLVGSHAEVRAALRGYLDLGVRALVLDGLTDPADLVHVSAVLDAE